MNKKRFKQKHHRCAICGYNEYVQLLDTHRIIHGKDGGEYNEGNTLSLCVNCHRKEHTGIIKIKDKFYSTEGSVVIYEEKGIEHIRLI